MFSEVFASLIPFCISVLVYIFEYITVFTSKAEADESNGL